MKTIAKLALVALSATLGNTSYAQLDYWELRDCDEIIATGAGTASSTEDYWTSGESIPPWPFGFLRTTIAIGIEPTHELVEANALYRAKRSALDNLWTQCKAKKTDEECAEPCGDDMHPAGGVVDASTVTYKEVDRIYSYHVSPDGSGGYFSWYSYWIKVKATGLCCCFCTTAN
jgi:hypothetical protein